MERELVARLEQMLAEQPLDPADASAYSSWILVESLGGSSWGDPLQAPEAASLRVSIELEGRQWVADVECTARTRDAIWHACFPHSPQPLSPQAERELRMRFGIGESAHDRLDFELTRERIRQIEAKALRRSERQRRRRGFDPDHARQLQLSVLAVALLLLSCSLLLRFLWSH